MVKIAIDCGHGLKTAGKQTPDGIKEWTLNDKVRDKAVSMLKNYECEIIFTDNNEGNVDESLSSRVKKYKSAGADAFVSIHHNANTGKWNNATGVEVYSDRNPTAKDKELANAIYKRLVTYTGLKGRGVKQKDFYVINQDTIPAVLVEGGFMDGRNDYKVITSDAGQEAYAKAVVDGLVEFLNLKKKTSTNTPTTSTKIDVVYQVHAKNKSWLSEITNYNTTNSNGYAGWLGYAVTGFRAKTKGAGHLEYRAHSLEGNKWYGWRRDYDKDSAGDTFAGTCKTAIDGVQFRIVDASGKHVRYRVHTIGKGWLSWITDYGSGSNGYAGWYGYAIDAIQIEIV